MYVQYYDIYTDSNTSMITFLPLWPHLTSSLLFSCFQLQLHANKRPVLWKRKGGKPNWIECNSVHQPGNESIMLRNGFRRTEYPPRVRVFFCLEHKLCVHAYVFYDRLINNHSTYCFIPGISSCDVDHAALQKMPYLFALSSVIGWLEWFFHWL